MLVEIADDILGKNLGIGYGQPAIQRAEGRDEPTASTPISAVANPFKRQAMTAVRHSGDHV